MDVNGLLSLQINNGDVVKVTTDGQDAYSVMRSIENVFARHTERKTMSAGRHPVSHLVPA